MHSLERGFHIARWTACVIGCRGYVPQRGGGGGGRNHIDPEPYTPRRRRINKDFPSRAFSRTGEYFKHPTPPFLSPPAYSRFYYLGARNIFYRLDTASKLSSPSPQLCSFSQLLFFSSFSCRGHEYVRRMFSRCSLFRKKRTFPILPILLFKVYI